MLHTIVRCGSWLFTCLAITMTGLAQADPQAIELKKRKILSDQRVASVEFSPETGNPALIVMNSKNGGYKKPDLPEIVTRYLDLRSGVDRFEALRSPQLKDNMETVEYIQLFKGVKVEHGGVKALFTNGELRVLNGAWFDIPLTLSTQPSLSEAEALAAAKTTVGAAKYAWEEVEEVLAGTTDPAMRESLQRELLEYKPGGELVIIKDHTRPGALMRLAYKFNIYAAQPLSRQWIYVDAMTGKILLLDKIIKHLNEEPTPRRVHSVSTVVHTRYAGVQSINVKQLTGTALNPALDPILGLPVTSSHPTTEVYVPGSSTYVLIDDTKGDGIETYDLNGVGGVPLNVGAVYSQAKSFTDQDNNWDSTEHTRGGLYGGANEAENDDIAWDAHWGASVVYDYWLEKHNRLSFDGNNARIRSFIHYGPAYDNAFWNGSAMTYGDGSGTTAAGFRALTSLDVCGHEIGHAVCSNTSDLVYASESGAMNEAFSDIWAACIEHFAMTRPGSTVPANKYRPFYIGEQIGADYDSPLRRMDNPKDQGNPDTYGGVNWINPSCSPNLVNDQCGVHTNSGVLNHWFFLMTAGSLNGTRGPGTATYYLADSDDELRDGPNSDNTGGAYTVNGLGFDLAERIAFITETMLTSTATYAEARAVSIAVATALSGDECSGLVESVTNAWYAVGVGDQFISPCLTTFGFIHQPGFELGEGTITAGCDAQKTFFVPVLLPPSSTATLVASGSASPDKDYTLSSTSLSNASASDNKVDTFSVFIKNDAVIENAETIQLTITVTNTSSNPVNTGYTISLTDDDVLPVIGTDSLILLNETFTDANTGSPFNLPAAWAELLEIPEQGNVDPTATTGFNHWGLVDNKLGVTGKTSIANLPDATYNDLSPSQAIARTVDKIDARGLHDLVIRFDYTVQGEIDPLSPPGDFNPDHFPRFDYMAIVYSIDGVNWVELSNPPYSQFASLLLSSGTYRTVLPADLNNQQFYLGFRWLNDANAGGPFSVTIDNLTVKAAPVRIENDLADNGQEGLVANESVYYYSSQDREIIGNLQCSASDACQTMSVARTGNTSFTWYVDALGFNRVMDKIIAVSPATGTSESFDITLYFTEDQIAALESLTGVPRQDFQVYHSTSIDYTGANSTNTTKVAGAFTPIPGVGGYFTASFTGDISGAFAVGASLAESPLPVTCVDFSASKSGSTVMLKWKVADERNNGSFAVERSVDGVHYTVIGTVAANGSGHGDYGYHDVNTPGSGKLFYRLRQTDIDGQYRYICTILQVQINGLYAFTVGNLYPNPSSAEEVFVNVINDRNRRISIEIVTASGQLISSRNRELNAGSTRVALELSAIPAGNYFVRFRGDEGQLLDVKPLTRY